MGTLTRYLLPIAQALTAHPWEREDGISIDGHLSVNDEPGLPGMVSTVPTVEVNTYVRGTGTHNGEYQPSISYWRYGELPLTAANITVQHQAYLGCGMAGPSTRNLRWLTRDFVTQSWSSPLFTVTNYLDNYQLYSYDFGGTEPFAGTPWSAALLNSLYFGLEAYENTDYATLCPANWLRVQYDDVVASPHRGAGMLL